MAIRFSPKTVAIAVLGATVIGLGTVVAVDHTSGAPSTQRTSAATAGAARNTSDLGSASSLSGTSLLDTASGTPAGQGSMAARIAQLFGLTPEQLKADIQSGQTLDQIAGARDQTIKQEILTFLNAELGKAVSKGAITPSQQSSLSNDASDAITQLFGAQLGKLGAGG